ncbi:ankyrin repeat domain-containing protein 60 [Hemicordylus capensis]|uniref:ankyrin repeat domain-containing protein 60 n=1 Tax=Hemicordylus capensis TaxID=884348 RepID=UPI00230467A8|nr:ankyrin repeat domain-containing protein 60 [Hemicordylus capensis]
MPSKKKQQRGRAPPSKAELRFHAASLSYLRPGDPGLAPNLRPFSVKLNVVEANEVLTVPDCYRDLTMRSLKNRLELLAGIPVNFQRLQYLDEVDLDDNSTFKMNDIIPGGTITMRIWQEDAWARLVSTAAKGNFIGMPWNYPGTFCKKMLFHGTMTPSPKGKHLKSLQGLGATMRSPFRTAHAARLKPEALKDWLAHRAFVALFITAHRGHLPAVEFLLENGSIPSSEEAIVVTVYTELFVPMCNLEHHWAEQPSMLLPLQANLTVLNVFLIMGPEPMMKTMRGITPQSLPACGARRKVSAKSSGTSGRCDVLLAVASALPSPDLTG